MKTDSPVKVSCAHMAIVVALVVGVPVSGSGTGEARAAGEEEAGEAEGSRGANASAADERDWVQRELLRQLRSVRQEQAEIKERLEAIEEAIAGARERRSGQGRGESPGRQAEGSIAFDPRRTLGDKQASVAIVEFTDFECSFCGRFHRNTYPTVKSELVDTGQVLYAVRDFPLPMHGNARGAAVAANCAGEQGRYWAMHDALFAHQDQLSPSLYGRQAQQIGLDVAAFEQCLESEEQKRAVQASLEHAQARGVRATPTFYIGRVEGNEVVDGRVIQGARGYGAIEQAVSALGQEQ